MGQQESRLLARMRGSSYVVDHYGSFVFKGEYVIAMELLDWKREFTLASRSRSYIETTLNDGAHDGYVVLAKIAVQLLCALVDLNQKGIVHCDIKPENIMFMHGYQHRIKIIDFGNATYIKDLNAYHDNFEVQSKAYRSPEVLLGDDTFDEKIDVWSVGVVLLELYVNGLFKSHNGVWRLVKSGERSEVIKSLSAKFGSLNCYKRAKYWDPSYDYAKAKDKNNTLFLHSLVGKDPNENRSQVLDFLHSLLILDHRHRISAEKALRHPFLTGQLLGDWGKALLPNYRDSSHLNAYGYSNGPSNSPRVEAPASPRASWW